MGTECSNVPALVGANVVLVGYGMLNFSAPLLIAFLLVSARISGPATQIQQGYQHLAHGLAAYEAIDALLAELGSKAQPDNLLVRDAPSRSITLDCVNFQHPQAESLILDGVRDVCLTIQPESLLAIRPRQTIIMITHRAKSLMLCDRVFRMGDGRLFDDAPQARAASTSGLTRLS